MAIGPAVGINGGGTNHLAPSNPEQDKQFLEAMVKQLVASGESLQTIPKQLKEQLFAVAKQAGVSPEQLTAMIEQGKSQKELLGALKQLAQQGVALESLSPEDQKKLAELAAKAGIPPQQLNEVFAKVKNQVEFEKANGKSAAAQLSEGQARNQKMAGVKLLENEIIKMTLEGKTLDTLSPERQQNIKNLVQGLGMTQQQFGAFVTQTQQLLAKAATP